jgi:SAM-dependent methyltransferase
MITARQLVPQSLVEAYRHVRRMAERQRNRGRTTEQVFTDIYRQNKWGGMPGELSSGDGSADQAVVSAYVEMITARAASEGFAGLRFVDLGCGDFRVGRQLLPLCSSYVGVDIVEPVVRHNQQNHGNASTNFMHLDIVSSPLPEGDVCFVRQVLQHLSNAQISAVLAKLSAYRWVFITEHCPSDRHGVLPNKDKPQGGDIRAYDNSGVYLDEAPFSLPGDRLAKVLSVPGIGLSHGADQGEIVTYLYRPVQS